MKNNKYYKKSKRIEIPSLFIIGGILMIVVLIGLYLIGLYHSDNYINENAINGYSYQDLKEKYTVVYEDEVYEFMNSAIFNSDKNIEDKREFIKLNCFTLYHSTNLKKFIHSIDESILTNNDKKYIQSQFQNKILLWDQDKLTNAWCLTPQDIYRLEENNNIDYWENFRKNFGNYGYHHYSKPIFNREKNIVIIEHSGQGDWLLGNGSIQLFKKENGKWKRILELDLWIS